MITHGLFPTPVCCFDLGRDLSSKEKKLLLNQDQKSNASNTTSVDRNLLENTKLSSLRKFVETSLDEYIKEICSPAQDIKLRITQSWANYTKPGQHHHKHVHPNSLISGVFYVKTNKDSDRIYFYRDGYQQIKLPVDQWNLFNSDSWWLTAETGQLLLFPSFFRHMVETVEGDDTRVSLSFNTFPVGYIGDDEALTGLDL